MEARLARYPFLDAARDAVRTADVDLATVVEGNGPVVDRALSRVTTAIDEGRVGPPTRSARTELLSYPVARVIVSLADEPGLRQRYARAEARTAYDRFTDDLADAPALRSVDRDGIELDVLLSEFELSDAVQQRETDEGEVVHVDVGRYLALADGLDGERWRLVNRALSDGSVALSREEFFELLREAIRHRVADGLPLSVPDEIATALEHEVERVRERLADVSIPSPNAVAPDRYPPCVQALQERAADGGPMAPHSRFALVSFLASIGVEDEAIVASFSEDAEAVREQVAHLRSGESAAYPPPSCATMQAYGDCVNRDALCETIPHPLVYYEQRLDGVDPDQVSRPESQ